MKKLSIGIKGISLGGYSGIKFYTRNLIKALSKLDVHINLYTTFKQKDVLHNIFLDCQNINIINNLPHPRILGKTLEPFVNNYTNRKFLKSALQDVDIVHWMNPNYHSDDICKSAVTVHDIFPLYNTDWAKQAFGSNHNKEKELFHKVIEDAKIIFVPSETVKAEINNSFTSIDINKITVAHLAPADDFELTVPDNIILSEFGLKPNELFFLFVSQLNPRKNLNTLLEAYSDLVKKTSSAPKLVIVGNGNSIQRDDFRKTINKLGIENKVIHLTGVPDHKLMHLYNAALCLVFPSFAEGFGLPIIEAMKCGCPVVTSNLSSMAEVAGDAAIKIDPYSVRDIYNALQFLTEDIKYRNYLKSLGIERAKNFTWEKTAQKHIIGYNRALEI